MIFPRIVLNIILKQKLMDLARIKFSENFKRNGQVKKEMSYDPSRFPKVTFENSLGTPTFRAQVCVLTSSSLLFETSVESRSIPSLHLVLSALLNLLLDLGFLLMALPLLPCFPSGNSSRLKSLVRKTNRTSIRCTFQIKGEEGKFITVLRDSDV